MIDLTYFSANFLFKSFVDTFFVWVSILISKNLVDTPSGILYHGAIVSVTMSMIYYAVRLITAFRSYELNKMKMQEQFIKNEIAKKELENLNNNQDDNETITEI